MRPRLVGLLTALCVLAGLTATMTPDPTAEASAAVTAARADTRPNIVLITADDMRADDVAYMPRTRQLLGRQGATFEDAVSNYPLCCPARATILTGQYNHNNGVLGNEYPHGGHRKFVENGAELETLPVWLRRAGYSTAFLGKYLNYYGSTRPFQAAPGTGPRHVPPGWTDWHALVGGVMQYNCPTVNHNGQVQRHRGSYQTDLFSDLSADLIGTYAKRRKPFFLWASHLAPHLGHTGGADGCTGTDSSVPVPAAKRHEGMFRGMPLPASTSRNEEDMSDKNTYLRGRKKLDLAHQAEVHRTRLQALQSLDDAVGETVAALKRNGVLDNTLIVFMSDNGWMFGEHRAQKKILPYEESLRVPLLVRGPGVPAGVRRHQPVGIVDFAPTALEVSRAKPTKAQDGVSLVGLARDPSRLARRVMPIESGPMPGMQRQFNTEIPDFLYRGVRSTRYSYVEWQFDDRREEEFYDLAADPDQLESRHLEDSPALTTARAMLPQLQDCAGTACVREMPADVDSGTPRPRPSGDAAAPQVRVIERPRGWVRTPIQQVRYTATDATDGRSSLKSWCSHQARDCDGTATLRAREEGIQHWTVHVTDRAGNVGSAYGSFGVDLFAPRVRTTRSRDLVVQGRRAPLGWLVDDTGSGLRGIDTRIRTALLDGRISRWRSPLRMRNRQRPLPAVATPADGSTVCLEVRARDKIGRRTRWTRPQCRARALDAAVLTKNDPRWRSPRRRGWFGRTATVARTRGTTLTVDSAGPVGTVRVVAVAGRAMGRARVRVGNQPIGWLMLDRAGRGRKEFVLPARGRRGPVTITLASAGRPVWVDSVGVVRRPAR